MRLTRALYHLQRLRLARWSGLNLLRIDGRL